MPSERIQRQIDALLDEADTAIKQLDWPTVLARAQAALTMDAANSDAQSYLAIAERGLATVTPEPASDQRAALPAPAPTPTAFAGGRYQVKRFLGEGGKKKVYLAHDTLLDRDVAFALIKTEGLDEVGRQRITREAQAMGRLGSHPHIVSVFDLGEEPVAPSPLRGEGRGEGDRTTQPFMVTELMGGGDVEGAIEKAAEHKLPLERALEIANQTCRGLEFAHSKGVVHRDLKPGNVWLTSPLPLGEGKGEGRGLGGAVAKIGDFGLAVAVDRSRLTREGMMVGTVSYMPPEQATGGEITPRSDLYSLGAMLYEMVCGRPPFVGDDSVAIIGQHLNTPPVSPSWHRPDLPPALESLLLRLLEKDPGKRPESAAAVRQALESIDLSPLPLGEGKGEGRVTPTTDNPLYRRTFVGREQELSQLKAAFDRALSGQGGLVMVVGEPGIGKTALCEQLATYATLRGGVTLVGHCYEEGSLSLPYLAFVEAMRSYVLSREPDALRSELGTGAADVARIVSEIRDKLNVELRPSSDPEDDRWRLYQSVSGFLKNASTVQPLLIVLEDLHWADRGTLDLLVHVARNLAGARLLIIGTYRDVEVDRSHPLSGTLAELRRSASGGFARVLLRGLTPDEVQRMLSNISNQEITWGFAEAVHRQTEGNPLFVQEVVRYLVEEKLVTHEGGRWRPTGNTPLAMSIPEGLRDVIGKRLSRLTPECNRLLTIAAVVGRDFALETLRLVASSDEEALLAALEEALRVGVLEEQSRGGLVRYRFAHAFFRQTLYEEMIAPRRIQLHQQVARALEQQYAIRLEEHATELAEHFAYSSDPGDLAKAVSYCELAARRATGVYSHGEAARLLEGALQVQEVLDPEDKAKRCDLLLALGEALMPAGEPQRAAGEVAEEAFTLAEALGDRERASRACRTALMALRQYGSTTITGTATFREWVERGDRCAPPDTVDRVYVDEAMSMVAANDSQYGQAWTLRSRSLELARRLGDVEALWYAAWGMLYGGSVAAAPDHYQELVGLAEEFAQRPRAGVSARTLGLVLRWCVAYLLGSGQRRRAQELWREADTLAERTQEPTGLLMSILNNEVTQATLDGQLDAAVQAGERLVFRAEELGSPVLGLFYRLASTLPALLYLGRAEEALNQMSQAARMAGTEVFGPLRAPRLVCLAMLDRRDEAQMVLEQLRILFGIDQPDSEAPIPFLMGLCEAAMLLGDRETASQTAPRLIPLASVAWLFSGTTSVPRLLGGAAALLGEPEQARSYYQQALEVCAKIRFRPEIALTRLGLAELLLEEAEKKAKGGPHPSPLPEGEGELRREAMEHLDFAIGEFREMHMQPSLERALRHKELLKA